MTFWLVIGTLCPCWVGPRRRSCILLACEWQDGFHLQAILILRNNAIIALSLETRLFMEAGNCNDRHFWSPLTQYATNSILTLILKELELTLTRRFQGGKLGLIHCYLSKASPCVGLFFLQLFPAYSSVYVPCSFAAESMFVIFVIRGVKHTHTHNSHTHNTLHSSL